MPELPEVETIREDLNKLIVHKKINQIIIRNRSIVKGNVVSFKRRLQNQTIKRVDRRGKLLIFILSNNYYLLVHLRMTGQIFFQDSKHLIGGGHAEKNSRLVLPAMHTHLVLRLSGSSNIFYNDSRRFGYWQVVTQQEFALIEKHYGPEPLADNFSLDYWLLLCKANKSKFLKVVLLDQTKIAGIGNIYADEICFAAKVKPTRTISSLRLKEKKNIFLAIKKIIKNGVKYRGTTFSDYRDASGHQGNYLDRLKVYGRQNKSCLKCGQAITKIRFHGRGTHYCQFCQY